MNGSTKTARKAIQLKPEYRATHDKWLKAGSNNSTHIIDSVWDSAKRAAADTLKRLGRAKCGPHDYFEGGMINGKLSAIRWMLGDDWDVLNT